MSAKIEPLAPLTADAGKPAGGARAYVLAAADAANAGQFHAALLENGCACDVVGNAADVLRAFSVRDYDLILLDLHSPPAACLEAAKVLRDRERHFPEPRVPVLIFTAGASDAERAEARTAGADDAAVRPCDADGWKAVLKQGLAEERRSPPTLIPREPVQFEALLASCQNDMGKAHSSVASFADVLHDTIADARTGLAAGDLELLHRIAEQLRRAASQSASGRVQRTSYLMTRLDKSAGFASRGKELLQELELAEADLSTWRELQLGQSVADSKPRSGPIKTNIIRLSSFLKNRLDIFSKSPAR